MKNIIQINIKTKKFFVNILSKAGLNRRQIIEKLKTPIAKKSYLKWKNVLNLEKKKEKRNIKMKT